MFNGGGSYIGLAGMNTYKFDVTFNKGNNMVASADLYGDASFDGAGVMSHIQIDTDDGIPLNISRFRLRITQRDLTVYTRQALDAVIGSKPPLESISFRYHSQGSAMVTVNQPDFNDATVTERWQTGAVFPVGYGRANVIVSSVIDSPTNAGTVRISTATPSELNSYAVGDKMEIPVALGSAIAGAGAFNSGKAPITAIDAVAGWVEFADITWLEAVTVPSDTVLQPVMEIVIVKASGGGSGVVRNRYIPRYIG